ncbi:uncharacterized protein TNCV_4563741 [Trichonephila clavipes]|uniref:Uncharacterized protein n=1 Tax=Trichonephila clavipes TaxID=2585209 RepID=A0A8X7BF09_TRICX|nr:uncharacterized protein TNCV_4563741 [Trichonephila clavipes]
MKEGLIALNYECSKCNERMGLYERKSAVLDGDFEWVCSTITSQNIYGRTPMILLTMRPSRLFVKIRCHAVASTRKRSAVPLLSSEAKANFRYQQGAHGWSSENITQSPADQSRGFSTTESHWLGTRACAVLAISLRCQSMFRYFTARLEILTLKLGVGCHFSRPPRHSTEVPNHTVYERRVRYNPPDFAFSGYRRNKSPLSSSVDLPFP